MIAGRYESSGGTNLVNRAVFDNGKFLQDENGRYLTPTSKELEDLQNRGEISQTATLEPRYNSKNISVPDFTWKIVLPLEPGQGIEDVTVNTPIAAVMTPNIAEPAAFYLQAPGLTPTVRHPLYPDRRINQTEWRQWQTWQVSVDEIESRTGLDFFTELPDEVEQVLEANITDLSESDLPPVAALSLFPDDDDLENDLEATLLAESQASTTSPIVVFFNDSSIIQN